MDSVWWLGRLTLVVQLLKLLRKKLFVMLVLVPLGVAVCRFVRRSCWVPSEMTLWVLFGSGFEDSWLPHTSTFHRSKKDGTWLIHSKVSWVLQSRLILGEVWQFTVQLENARSIMLLVSLLEVKPNFSGRVGKANTGSHFLWNWV